jgi:hypothetical protein
MKKRNEIKKVEAKKISGEKVVSTGIILQYIT